MRLACAAEFGNFRFVGLGEVSDQKAHVPEEQHLIRAFVGLKTVGEMGLKVLIRSCTISEDGRDAKKSHGMAATRIRKAAFILN
jgi:hypothetical protein